MKIRKWMFLLFVLTFSIVSTSCFSLKDSPFYDSEWIMQNYDANGELYYHHLILYPNHRVMLRASYADSTNILVWTGKYKINSKKIVFDFAECVRYENGEIIGQYKSGSVVKYYNGDFFYSVGLVGDDEESQKYNLELIRPQGPKAYFYGENKDIFGNHLETFVKSK